MFGLLITLTQLFNSNKCINANYYKTVMCVLYLLTKISLGVNSFMIMVNSSILKPFVNFPAMSNSLTLKLVSMLESGPFCQFKAMVPDEWKVTCQHLLTLLHYVCGKKNKLQGALPYLQVYYRYFFPVMNYIVFKNHQCEFNMYYGSNFIFSLHYSCISRYCPFMVYIIIIINVTKYNTKQCS